MLTLEQARAILAKLSQGMRSVTSGSLTQGYVLARPVLARRSNPAFDYAAMDGFALGTSLKNEKYQIAGEVAAGEKWKGHLKPNECVRIMTGAPVPRGCTAVVPIEEVHEHENRIQVLCPFKKGQHIRKAGEDFKKGSVLLKAGTCLNSVHPGLIATAGYSAVWVYQKPRIAFFTTGNELSNAKAGVINSNRLFIRELLKKSAFDFREIPNASDTRAGLIKNLKKSMQVADVIITTGGVSAGKYDLLPQALKTLGAKILIRKVAIKPGKPFTVSKIGKKIIFSLPGNPGAVVATLYALVLPYLNPLEMKSPNKIAACMRCDCQNTGKRDLLAFVTLSRQKDRVFVSKIHDVNSGSVKVFNTATAILHIPAGKTMKRGARVNVLPII